MGKLQRAGVLVSIVAASVLAATFYQHDKALWAIGLLMLIFGFVFARSRHYDVRVVVLFGLLIYVLSSQFTTTLDEFRWGNLRFLASFAGTVREIVTPGSGQHVLLERNREMLRLIERNDLDDYRISDRWHEDTELYQRIRETAWPVLYEANSANVLILASESTSYSSCTPIDEEGAMLLVYCD